MILNRLGNKQRIASDIVKHFPPHKTFIDLFFGAGGLFFNKQKVKYNFCNDIDNDVFNLFVTLKDKKDELIKAFELMPIDETLLKYWNTKEEKTDINKAVRFLMLSNFGYMGKPETLCFGQSYGNQKISTLNKIEDTFKFIKTVQFMSVDFRNVLKKIQFRDNKSDAFIYSDPPYLNTTSNYRNKDWNEKDSSDCFDVTFNSGINGAMSEFNHPFILSEAKRRNLNIINIGERQNLKNKRTEILITNYKLERTLFDCV